MTRDEYRAKLNEPGLRCPKCARTMEVRYGRHAKQWWVHHPGIAHIFAPSTACVDASKNWTHCDTEELSVAAFRANDSNWRPLDPETLEFINRQIDVERDKQRRESRKGYAAG